MVVLGCDGSKRGDRVDTPFFGNFSSTSGERGAPAVDRRGCLTRAN